MDNVNKETIVNVFKFEQSDQIAWAFSTNTNEPNLFNYYILYIKDDIPTIENAINPISILHNGYVKLSIVNKDTPEYNRFLTTKKVAEKYAYLEEKCFKKSR